MSQRLRIIYEADHPEAQRIGKEYQEQLAAERERRRLATTEAMFRPRPPPVPPRSP